jgi:hypothetical protein
MQLLEQRSIATIDSTSLENRDAKEALFSQGDGFVLYLSDGAPLPFRQERLISLSSRQALLWLNEDQADAGSLWR